MYEFTNVIGCGIVPGWNPKTSLWDLLESTLTYQHRTYAEAIKQAIAKPIAS